MFAERSKGVPNGLEGDMGDPDLTGVVACRGVRRPGRLVSRISVAMLTAACRDSAFLSFDNRVLTEGRESERARKVGMQTCKNRAVLWWSNWLI